VLRVSRLYVHPVKSCRGQSVERVGIDRRGVVGDRRWMVVDAEGGFVTLRRDARLATIAARLEEETLVLEAPGMETLRRPAAPTEGTRRAVRVWEDACAALVDDEGSRWFSSYLGGDYGLVTMPPGVERRADPEWSEPGDLVSFVDAFPLLLIGQSSLEDLNGRLERPVAIERFRPNVVVEGSAPYAEDGWSRLRIGRIAFRGAKPCARCVATTVDPQTGAGGDEPLRTLATYRSAQGRVCFGMNLLHDGQGTLAIGDVLTPLPPAP